VNSTPARPYEILLVEDAPGDIRLTFEAFKKTTIESRLHVVQDGQEAVDFLTRTGSHAGAPQPDLILMDLNLPKLNGFELLSRIKTDSRLKSIPVVVLTASQNDEDIRKAYDLRANCYLVKPSNLTDFFQSSAAWRTFGFRR
jgi:CheY-like chemotaxis protein